MLVVATTVTVGRMRAFGALGCTNIRADDAPLGIVRWPIRFSITGGGGVSTSRNEPPPKVPRNYKGSHDSMEQSHTTLSSRYAATTSPRCDRPQRDPCRNGGHSTPPHHTT